MISDVNLQDPKVVAALIDHTLLKPEASEGDIERICAEAKQYGFAAVCVNPYWVPFASGKLAGTNTRVCTVCGFPLGANATAVKVAEAEFAIAQGAIEIDMVINIGQAKSRNFEVVRKDIEQVAVAVHSRAGLLKVILETCLLTNSEKVVICQAAAAAKADFVKTSTGFSAAGATVADVRLLRESVASGIGVKAAGGIRNLQSFREMVEAGANRIGTSSGVSILRDLNVDSAAKDPVPLSGARIPGGRPDSY